MAKDYKKTATEVLEKIGGEENISTVTHCVTRLRFVLKDESIVNDADVRAIEGVKGVAKAGGQYQVIIGTDVTDAFEALQEIRGVSVENEVKKEKTEVKEEKKDNLLHQDT